MAVEKFSDIITKTSSRELLKGRGFIILNMFFLRVLFIAVFRDLILLDKVDLDIVYCLYTNLPFSLVKKKTIFAVLVIFIFNLIKLLNLFRTEEII